MGDGTDNLKRGNLDRQKDDQLVQQEHGGALRTGWPEYDPENGSLARHRQEQEELRRRVREEEGAALEEIHFSLTSLTRKILKRAERKGEVPPKTTMDVVREFRQTQEAVNVARQARGAVAEAQEFLATLDTRVAEAAARMAAGPEPVAAVPA